MATRKSSPARRTKRKPRPSKSTAPKDAMPSPVAITIGDKHAMRKQAELLESLAQKKPIGGNVVGKFTEEQLDEIRAYEASHLSDKPQIQNHELADAAGYWRQAADLGLTGDLAASFVENRIRTKRFVESIRQTAQQELMRDATVMSAVLRRPTAVEVGESSADELNRQRTELFGKIKALHDAFQANGKKWSDPVQAPDWEAVTQQYDAVMDKLEAMRDRQPKQPANDCEHSDDFRSLCWFGERYSFTTKQAPAVRLLWENWEKGTPDVGDETLLLAIDPDAPPAKLNTLFRDHPGWGTMIVSGGSKGAHRLAEPKKI